MEIFWNLVEGRINVINYYLHHTGHMHNSLCRNSFFLQSIQAKENSCLSPGGQVKFCQELTTIVCNRCPLSIIVSNFKLDKKPILLQ